MKGTMLMTSKYKLDAMLDEVDQYICKGWTQGTFARDEEDRECSVNSVNACKWCLIGALTAATYVKYNHNEYKEATILLQEAIKTLYPDIKNTALAQFNDTLGRLRKDVREVIAKARSINQAR